MPAGYRLPSCYHFTGLDVVRSSINSPRFACSLKRASFGLWIAIVVYMATNPNLSNATRPRAAVVTSFPDQRDQERARTRGFIIAWAFALMFYFLEYAVRSSPSVMIPELTNAFGTTALGIGSILGVYYYTYSTVSLVAGAALDRLGAKRSIPVGAAILGLGCLLFSVPAVIAGDVGRLLQGAGSAFAFTGGVYLAAHGFSPQRLATAVGVTQCLGMLGGSAGQFAVGPRRVMATLMLPPILRLGCGS